MADNSENRRVERAFHPNGRVSAEVTYIGEHIDGVTRHWYENGIMQSEVPMHYSKVHGICRYWDSSGNLLDETEFVHGTGCFRNFYDNGAIQGEMGLKNGVPHGHQLCWDENGEFLAEAFYINGRKASRKRYEQARQDDPSLPEPTNAKPSISVEPTVQEATPDVATGRSKEEEEDWLKKLLGAGKHAEALSWLRNSNGILGEGIPDAEAIELIEGLYNAGAEEVIAIEIDQDLDGEENTGTLVVKLDDNTGHREKVLRICNACGADLGFDADRDVGQRYLLVMLD